MFRLPLATLLLLFVTCTFGLKWRVQRDLDEFSSESADVQDVRAEARTSTARQVFANLRQLIERGFADWRAYKEKHGKSYPNQDEDNERMLAYLSAKQFIDKHNQAFLRGEVSFEVGENHIADLPFDEYRKLNGFKRALGDALRHPNATSFLEPLNLGDVPESMDWRDRGLVTEVKNQGMCGSCWAFSATGALEGQHARKLGQLTSLSEQNLVDCSKKYGNMGCNGGLMDNAFQYVKDNHGIDTEGSYPYKAKTGRKCLFKPGAVGATDSGFVDLLEGDEEKLKIAVATQGPVSVAIDAGHRSFQLYTTGVYVEKECSPEDLDHGVLVVGYGTDPEQGDYWIVKNSWGQKWGEKDIIRGRVGAVNFLGRRRRPCGRPPEAAYSPTLALQQLWTTFFDLAISAWHATRRTSAALLRRRAIRSSRKVFGRKHGCEWADAGGMNTFWAIFSILKYFHSKFPLIKNIAIFVLSSFKAVIIFDLLKAIGTHTPFQIAHSNV